MELTKNHALKTLKIIDLFSNENHEFLVETIPIYDPPRREKKVLGYNTSIL